MKRFILFAVCMIFLLTACTYVNLDLRYGVWESDDPKIVMDINPEVERFGHEVIYTEENGDVIDLSVVFSNNSYNMDICRLNEDGTDWDTYFSGTYKVKGDKLTLTLINQEFAKTEYEEIIFVKTKEYEVESQEEEGQK